MNIYENALQKPALAVYFSAPSCNVCHALKPKLFSAIKSHFDKLEIAEVDVSTELELAAKFNVFTIPTLLVFFDGKEYVRAARHMSVDGVIGDIKRPYDMMFE